jgi:uncharacterized membrane protein YkvA (DUF1232 family)
MSKVKLRGFYEDLVDAIKSEEDGVYSDILKYAPSFFQLLCDILEDERADWYTRLLIDSALAYFVMPNDIISEEEYGVTGYIDDIFLCAYVLNEIKKKSGEELIVDNWRKKSNILKIIDEVLSSSKRIIGEQYSAILKFVGLRKESNLPSIIDKNNKIY